MRPTILRGAFLGYGNVARAGHVPFWRTGPGVAIVAAADPDAARRTLFESDFPEGRAYERVEDLLAEEQIDFVDICSSPSSHASQAAQALTAGRHVLCEKPLATSAADASRLADQALSSGRVVHTVHNWLAAPICREVSGLIGKGAIGDVRSIDWATMRTEPAVTVGGVGGANWRLDPDVAGGGILVDHGWHALYCVAAWAGAEPHSIAAMLERRRYVDLAVEDTAALAIEFDSGAVGNVYLTWAADRRANTVTIIGSRGRIDVEGDTITLADGHDTRRWTCAPSLTDGSHHPDWFARVGHRFLDAVREGGPWNIRDAVRCASLIDAAKRSSDAGGDRLALAWPPPQPAPRSRSQSL